MWSSARGQPTFYGPKSPDSGTRRTGNWKSIDFNIIYHSTGPNLHELTPLGNLASFVHNFTNCFGKSPFENIRMLSLFDMLFEAWEIEMAEKTLYEISDAGFQRR